MKQGHIGWACGSVLTVAALAGCGGDDKTAATGQPPSPAVEFRNADPNTTSPYSDAARAGSTLYLAGVLGLDDKGALVPGGIVPEAEKALQNLKGVLERNGSSLDRVANCEVMLADIKERDAFNTVYSKYWPQGKFPARHAFGVTGLYLGARVEIACTAIAV
jgi:reactive intermediate/imine deaminase